MMLRSQTFQPSVYCYAHLMNCDIAVKRQTLYPAPRQGRVLTEADDAEGLAHWAGNSAGVTSYWPLVAGYWLITPLHPRSSGWHPMVTQTRNSLHDLASTSVAAKRT